MVSDYWNERRDKFLAEEQPEVPRRSGKRKKKNTKRWCKGIEGREHEPTMIMRNHRWPCGPIAWRRNGDWYCWHVKMCKTCRKVLAYNLPDCPDLPEVGGC